LPAMVTGQELIMTVSGRLFLTQLEFDSSLEYNKLIIRKRRELIGMELVERHRKK
jgi:hypothetical protein